MSDYGDEDYIEFDEDWIYVEDEYTAADDLAEHAVGSPPPANCLDEVDPILNWDRYDYFNDLEYASDGYDDANFEPYRNGETGKKRKRAGDGGRGTKLRRLGDGSAATITSVQPVMAPVVWRAQADRDPKPKVLEDGLEPYALLKDWRVRLANIPAWATGSPGSDSDSNKGKGKAVKVTDAQEEIEAEADEEEVEDGAGGIDAAALMASLQKNLAAAGGPLSGMDPQQLLQFAMRMMNDEGAGDDIAGELADDMLKQGEDDEEGEEEPADLLAWLARQKGEPATTDAAPAAENATSSRKTQRHTDRPPTPPSSEANQGNVTGEDRMEIDGNSSKNAAAKKRNNHTLELSQEVTRKRKADEVVDVGEPATSSKKRATRSFAAPTAASEAKTTRSGRTRR